jgi:hypothetical protein
MGLARPAAIKKLFAKRVSAVWQIVFKDLKK